MKKTLERRKGSSCRQNNRTYFNSFFKLKKTIEKYITKKLICNIYSEAKQNQEQKQLQGENRNEDRHDQRSDAPCEEKKFQDLSHGKVGELLPYGETLSCGLNIAMAWLCRLCVICLKPFAVGVLPQDPIPHLCLTLHFTLLKPLHPVIFISILYKGKPVQPICPYQ